MAARADVWLELTEQQESLAPSTLRPVILPIPVPVGGLDNVWGLGQPVGRTVEAGHLNARLPGKLGNFLQPELQEEAPVRISQGPSLHRPRCPVVQLSPGPSNHLGTHITSLWRSHECRPGGGSAGPRSQKHQERTAESACWWGATHLHPMRWGVGPEDRGTHPTSTL